MVKSNLHYETAIDGAQYQLRQSRSALSFAVMKLQDSGRPEIDRELLLAFGVAEANLKHLQERLRELSANFDEGAPLPVENQVYVPAQ